MLQLRPAKERGFTQIDWLTSYHSFSFGGYRDPKHMGFGPLRVINDDIIAPGGGFGTHPHRDMEIITLVLEGALAHKDSLGTGSTIHAGEVQRMSAGTGIAHSEYNASDTQPVHLLQMWIIPDKEGYAPGYAQKDFARSGKANVPLLLVSGDGRNGSLSMHQDAELYTLLVSGSCRYDIRQGRLVWVHVTDGNVKINGHALHAGDGLAAWQEPKLEFTASEDAALIFFDLPE